MGAFWGGMAALGIGVTDLFGRRIVLAASAVTAAFVIQVMGVIAALAMVLVVPSRFGWVDLGWGAVSGLGMAAGLGCYYGGLHRSASTIVSPIVATLSAVIPYAYAVVRGGEVTTLAVVGAGVAFVGLAIIGGGVIDRSRLRDGLVWGVLSGLGYGFGISALVEVTAEAGVWPAVSQRSVAVVALGLAAHLGGHLLVPPTGLRLHGLAGGVAAGLTSAFILIGFEADAPAAVVTTSMFPIPVVAIGVLVYGDRLVPRQAIGITVALLGVAAVVSA